MSKMNPREILHKLDSHIIGQHNVKRSVLIYLRNLWRRMLFDAYFRQEIIPNNILMISPTDAGKTDIVRRMAKLAKAHFIKVKTTKFIEVSYVGKELEQIIRDLTDSHPSN